MRYAALSEFLEEAGVALSLSELHGGLCGLLCAAGTGAADTWLEEVIGVGDSGVRVADKMVRELRVLRLETWGSAGRFPNAIHAINAKGGLCAW